MYCLHRSLSFQKVVRAERQFACGLKAAVFREPKTLEDFDWNFNRTIKKKPIFDLAVGGFVRQRRNVLLAGPPCVGKSHLAQVIGRKTGLLGHQRALPLDLRPVRDFLYDEAFAGHDKIMMRYLKPYLLILDDMGHKQLPKNGGIPLRDHHAAA